MLADTYSNANIIYYSRLKSNRITRRVLAAELFSIAHVFDTASTMPHALAAIYGRLIPLAVYEHFKILYEANVEANSSAEKQLLTDLTLQR